MSASTPTGKYKKMSKTDRVSLSNHPSNIQNISKRWPSKDYS
jgi:hypothetical protein